MNKILKHFPATKQKWGTYFKVFMPIVIGSMMFALNGVVDNFMVGHIDKGQPALGAINSWTNIFMGWCLGTAAGGSVLAGQFYHAKKYKIVQQVARYRFYLTIVPAIFLAIAAWVDADSLAKIFIAKKDFGDTVLIHNVRAYAHVIAIQWILISVSFNLGNQLREIGYGKWTMYWGFGTLTTNISLNAILMYGVGMGVEGAAWASAAGRLVALSVGIYVILKYKVPIGFKPWTLFNVSWKIRKLFWRRYLYILSIFTVVFFITLRNRFYGAPFSASDGYLGVGVSGMHVLSLTGALANVITVTFSALTSMAAQFVGSECGKNNFKQARINSDELKGFNTTMAVCMGIIGIIFAICIPYMHFFSKDQFNDPNNPAKLTFDSHAHLLQVSKSMIVICSFYPLWIWFSTSYRNAMSGGKGGIFALTDWVTTGPIQILWLWIISSYIVPISPFIQHNFWMVYILFFSSDVVIKMVWQEINYYKVNWIHSLTKNDVIAEKAEAQNISEFTKK